MVGRSDVNRLAAVLLLFAGCSFEPSGEGQQCSPEGDCAPGLQCCDGVCRAECGDVDMGAPNDAGVALDSDHDGGTCDDDDQDGICNDIDNCPTVANPRQGDCDGQNGGDACDPIFTAACVTVHGTFASAAGVTQVTGNRVVGVVGEPAHTTSSGNGFQLRGGLLPKASGGAQ